MNDDLIRRQDAIDAVMDLPDCENGYSDVYDKAYIIGVLEELPSAQTKIIYCKNCKYWKDSDGIYRRGFMAESKCPLNIKAVYEGTFYCGFGE